MYSIGSFGAADDLSIPVQFTTPSWGGDKGPDRAALGLSALVAFTEQVGGDVIRAVVDRYYDPTEKKDSYTGIVIARLPMLEDVTQWVLTSPPLKLAKTDVDAWKAGLESGLNKLGWGWSASGWKQREDGSWILTVRGEPIPESVYAKAVEGRNAPDAKLLAEATPETAVVEADTAAAVPAAAAALRASRMKKLGIGLGIGTGVLVVGGIVTAIVMKRREEG
jgi:hypothetical protein